MIEELDLPRWAVPLPQRLWGLDEAESDAVLQWLAGQRDWRDLPERVRSLLVEEGLATEDGRVDPEEWERHGGG